MSEGNKKGKEPSNYYNLRSSASQRREETREQEHQTQVPPPCSIINSFAANATQLSFSAEQTHCESDLDFNLASASHIFIPNISSSDEGAYTSLSRRSSLASETDVTDSDLTRHSPTNSIPTAPTQDGPHIIFDVQANSTPEISDSDESDDSSQTESSDSDTVMASSILMPPKFHGLSEEDAAVWFRDLQNYCAYKHLDEAGRLGLIPLLLKDGARHWFEGLADNQKDTFANLSAAFTNQFRRDETARWRDSAAVWSSTQSRSQSVEDFINQIQTKAMRANMTEEQTRFSIIHGLRPDIRQAVLQHEPNTVALIKKWATIAEAGSADSSTDSVTEAVRRLEAKFDGLQATSADRTPRTRSNSPRVRFSNPDRDRNPNPYPYPRDKDYRREDSYREPAFQQNHFQPGQRNRGRTFYPQHQQ